MTHGCIRSAQAIYPFEAIPLVALRRLSVRRLCFSPWRCLLSSVDLDLLIIVFHSFGSQLGIILPGLLPILATTPLMLLKDLRIIIVRDRSSRSGQLRVIQVRLGTDHHPPSPGKLPSLARRYLDEGGRDSPGSSQTSLQGRSSRSISR